MSTGPQPPQLQSRDRRDAGPGCLGRHRLPLGAPVKRLIGGDHFLCDQRLPERPMISVRILTKYEQQDLPGCLESVAWCMQGTQLAESDLCKRSQLHAGPAKRVAARLSLWCGLHGSLSFCDDSIVLKSKRRLAKAAPNSSTGKLRAWLCPRNTTGPSWHFASCIASHRLIP
jgi:hypothetical protein